MSLGPVFELPNALASHLQEAAATKGIRVESPGSQAQGTFPGLYMFRRGMARIWGRWRTSGDSCQIWLTFPRSHAFNPLLWLFDFYLMRRVEQMLGYLGAHRINWSA
jgi:hypothetical protein